MQLLSVFIQERNFKWPELVARCAEKFVAMNALSSSGFQLALAELLINELEERSRLYITHITEVNIEHYEEFLKSEEEVLRKGLSARFDIMIPGKERCDFVRKKYVTIILSTQSQCRSIQPIGFN